MRLASSGLKVSSWQLFFLKIFFDFVWYVFYVPFAKKQNAKAVGLSLLKKKKQALEEFKNAKEPSDLMSLHRKLLKL